jgi:hypothetical protein
VAKQEFQQNSTSNKIRVNLQSSASTTGQGLTGLTSASSGLTAYYYREGDTSDTAISLITATLGTWTSGGFIVVDGTNMPGEYELGIPNLAFANLGMLQIFIQGAANLVEKPIEIAVVAFNPYDQIRLGLTALPSAAVGSGANSFNFDGSGNIKSNTEAINGIACSSVTTVNAIQGTTINPTFDANNAMKVDVVDFGGTAGTFSAGTPSVALTASGMDAVLIESSIVASTNLINDASSELTSINARQGLSIMSAALCGALSGAGGTSITIPQTAVPAGHTRLAFTVDSNGNRSLGTIQAPT